MASKLTRPQIAKMIKADEQRLQSKVDTIAKADRKTMDGWSNVLTGMGQMGMDRKEQTTFAAEFRLPETMQRNLYTYSGLCRSIVDSIVDDAFRKWFTVEGDTSNFVLDECKRLSVQFELSRAWRHSRTYGGALVVVMANDGRKMSEPLNWNGIQNIEKLKVYHRWRVSRQTLYLDANKPNYAETELYLVAPIQPLITSFLVHESRCLIFDGVDVAPEIRVGNQWWGDSVFQSLWARLRGLGESYSNIEHIIGEFLLFVTKIKGLSMKLATKEGEQEIISRQTINNMMRHLMGAYVIDADGEDATRHSATTTGLSELMEKMMMAVSAETRIPIRKLFGTPFGGAGLSNNGDNEMMFYYDHCVSERNNHAQLPIERLIKMIMLQKNGPFKGREIPNWKINWAPLMEEPMSVQLANRKTQAETDMLNFQMGVLSSEEIRLNRFQDSFSFDTIVQKKLPTAKGVDNQGNLTSAH